MSDTEWTKRNEAAWLIVHDLVESAREDVRLKVENAPPELVHALNMAIYVIRSRPSVVSRPDRACRDWIEDFPHENGDYECRCCECG